MRVLIVSALGETTALAIRLMAEGNAVRYYVHAPDEADCGDGMVPKSRDWRRDVAWADIVVFDDVEQKVEGRAEKYGGGRWAEEIRRIGKRVVGGTTYGDRLENDRIFAQQELRRHGVPVVPMHRFTNFQTAIRFVEKVGGAWALKHNGQVDRNLATVGWKPDQIIGFMEWLDAHWRDLSHGQPVDFVLQEAVKGVEVAVTGLHAASGFYPLYYVNQEEKKLMDGDEGPSTGQTGEVGQVQREPTLALATLAKMAPSLGRYSTFLDVNCIVAEDKVVPLEFTCYDDQTEVLTESGWKLFKDVVIGEEVATLDPSTGKLEYRPNTGIVAKPYKGEMIHFHAKGAHSSIDLCVTPDHSMWVRNAHRDRFEFVPAERVAAGGGWNTKKTALWDGVDRPTFVIPGYVEKHGLGWHGGTFDVWHAPIEMPMETWLRFLGLYLSEGSCNSGQVMISQKSYRDKVRDALADFPIPVIEDGRGFTINSTQLAKYVKQFGTASEKRVPREFLDLCPKYLEVLLDSLMLGDGSVHRRTGQRVYYTTSRGLADDVQELMLKTGRLGIIRIERAAGTEMSINGRTYRRNHDQYIVYERSVKKDGYIDRRLVDRVPYNGMVYCLVVPPHHLLYVRRNGNPIWCGNCRPGFPTVWSILEALDGPVTDVLRFLAGEPVTPAFTRDFVMNVVVAGGTFPDQDKERNKGLELLGVDKTGIDHVWLNEVRLVGSHLYSAGSMGYMAVVTGRGKTILEAQKTVYAMVDQLKIVPYRKVRRDIGDKSMRDWPQLREWSWVE